MFIIVYKTLYANAVKRKVNLTSTVKRRQHPLNRLFIHFKVHIKKKMDLLKPGLQQLSIELVCSVCYV